MGKPTKTKPGNKESRKQAIAKIAAENRAYFEKLDAETANPSALYVCPHCSNECSVSGDLIGGDVNCPQCANTFHATPPARASSFRELGAAATKTITVICVAVTLIVMVILRRQDLAENAPIDGNVMTISMLMLSIAAQIAIGVIIANLFDANHRLLKTRASKATACGMGGVFVAIILGAMFSSEDLTTFFKEIAAQPPQKSQSGQTTTGESKPLWSKLIPAAFKEVEVAGTVYVKLNSGNSVPLSMVKVAVYEEGFISNKIAAINDYIRKELVTLPERVTTYKQRKGEIEASEKHTQQIAELKSSMTYWWQIYQADKSKTYAYQQYQSHAAAYQRATANYSGGAISQEYKDLIKDPVDNLENAVQLMVILNLKVLSIATDEPIWGGAIATSVTDKDGKFKITLPGTGHYALFAITSRRSPPEEERYIFFRRPGLLKMGNIYTIDLNNQHERVGDYTEHWSKETRNETSDLNLFKYVLRRIMRNAYGLDDVNYDPNLKSGNHES